MRDSLLAKLRYLLFCTTFITFAYFYHGGQDNENARFDQTRAIVELGKVSINKFVGNSTDVVKVGDNFFPNKAPGLSLLAVPAWWSFSAILDLFSIHDNIKWHLVTYLVTLFTVGLSSSLLCVLLFEVLRRFTGRETTAVLLALGYSLGTIAFPFSILFFSHQLSASLLFISFAILYLQRQQAGKVDKSSISSQKRWLRSYPLVAGLIAGFALVTEYPTAIAVAPIYLYGLLVLPHSRARLFFSLGICLSGSILAAYNLIAFGYIYFIPYSVYTQPGQRAFPGHSLGYMGVALPNFQVLLYILFQPQRGLFFCNPWLLMIIPSFFWNAFKQWRCPEIILSMFIVIAFLAFNSGFAPGIIYAGGGASVGPRHSIPMLPFAVLMIAPLMKFRWISTFTGILIVPSVAIMLMASAVEPRVPYEYSNPVRDLFFMNFIEGRFAISRYGTFSSHFMTNNSVGFNFAKLFNVHGELQLVPLILLWLAFLFLLFRIIDRSLHWSAKSFLVIFFICLAITPRLYGMYYRKEQGEGGGLQGIYYRGLVWQGCDPSVPPIKAFPKKIIRIKKDRTIDFKWGNSPPIEGQFSVEWSGKIQIDTPNIYLFATNSDDGSCLYIDGKLVIDNWGVHHATIKKSAIELNSGKHDVLIRYANEQFGAWMEFLWAPSGTAMQVVPERILFPNKPELKSP